jgi:catechol 2,3-dioxygenase-like lactoylglutathione lyase family enzyme
MSSPAGPLGHFLEIAIPTTDIAASVEFYERLGFAQCLTGDAWPHRYGVLSDGRIHLGLHERAPRLEQLTPCFVHAGVASEAGRLERSGLTPVHVHAGEESLHHLWLADPGGHPVLIKEARTFSPAPVDPAAELGARSLCGRFLQLSLPEPDFQSARVFWETAGFVGLPEEEEPYAHEPLTSDTLDLAFHAPRSCDTSLLVFEYTGSALSEQLQGRHIQPLRRGPRGLTQPGNLLIEAPEGTLLLLVPSAAIG